MKINQPTEFQGKENFQREGKRMREDAGFIGETLWVSYKIQEHCLPNMKSSLLAFLNANSCSFYAGIRFGLARLKTFLGPMPVVLTGQTSFCLATSLFRPFKMLKESTIITRTL